MKLTDGQWRSVSEGTFYSVMHIPWLGLPVQWIGSPIKILVTRVNFGDFKAEIYMLPCDRLTVNIINDTGEMRWSGISAPLAACPIGGSVFIALSVSVERALLFLSGKVVWVSDNPTGSVTVNFISGGRDASAKVPIERAIEPARLARRSSPGLEPERLSLLERHLSGRMQLLREDLPHVVSDDSHRLISIVGILRLLLCSGQGDGLLLRVAGGIDADLSVFGGMPLFADQLPFHTDFMFGPPPTFAESSVTFCKIDLEDWLQSRSVWLYGRYYSNEKLVKAFADKEVVHVDSQTEPICDALRTIESEKGYSYLVEWFVGVANMIIDVYDHRIANRTQINV
jgi:hypothetical protein